MKVTISMAGIDRKSDLIASRVRDQEPGCEMALAFLARGVLALLKLGMKPASIEESTRQFVARYRERGPTLIQPPQDDLRELVAEIVKKSH